MKTQTKKTLTQLTFSALCLALCMALPLLTGQIPEIGSKLLPMHIPVLLCGFICGWKYGFAVGFIAPLMRSLIFSMPPMFPIATAMAFELAAYGLISGILYKYLPKRAAATYFSLIVAMLMGRIVWGGAMSFFAVAGIKNVTFTLNAFIAGAFVNAVPGIIVQILLIPVLVFALKKAKLVYNE